MPYRETPLQNIKKHIKASKGLIQKIEHELLDENTDRAERTKLLLALAKCRKELRSLEAKKTKLANQKPHGTRLVGFHHLQDVFRADRCLMASYRFNGRTINVAVPDSENMMSLPRYNAYVASRDAAEKIARSANDVHVPDINVSAGTNVPQGNFQSLAGIMGSAPAPKKVHICDEGCRLFSCSVQDAARAAAAAMAAPSQTAAEAETESEPAPTEAAQSQTASEVVAPLNVAPLPDVDITAQPPVKVHPLRDNPSETEISKWLRDITSKHVTLTPDANLEGQTLDYWKGKAAVTVKRMMELYRGFSCTLSSEASMQFDNFRDRHLIPMLGKILYHDPASVKDILGADAAVLLDNSKAPEKPVIDRTTQVLTELRWRNNVR